MQKTTHFLVVIAILTILAFDVKALMLNRVTCARSIKHYMAALSHESIKGIPNCLKAGYKAAQDPKSKLAKTLEDLFATGSYGPALAAIIYMREKELLPKVDLRHRPPSPFLYGETAYLYMVAFEATRKNALMRQHKKELKDAHITKKKTVDFGDINENLLSLLDQVAHEKIKPNEFKDRIRLLIGPEIADAITHFHKKSEELRRIRNLKHLPKGQAPAEEVEKVVASLRSRIVNEIEKLLTEELMKLNKDFKQILKDNFTRFSNALKDLERTKNLEGKLAGGEPTVEELESRVIHLKEQFMERITSHFIGL